MVNETSDQKDEIYREYKPVDFLELSTFCKDEWKPAIFQISKSLLNYNGEIIKCFITINNNHIVGFVYGFILPNQTLLPEFLYVLPEHRKKGIGVNLIKKLENESGCSASMIYYNTTLHNYYAKQGYQTGDDLETAIKILNLTENI